MIKNIGNAGKEYGTLTITSQKCEKEAKPEGQVGF